MQAFSTILSKNPVHHSSDLSTKRNGTFFNRLIQPKLTINQPNDVYEQEADAVADRVMRMTDKASGSLFFKPTPISISSFQRKCAACEKEEKVQMKGEALAGGGMTAPLSVSNAISTRGQSLDRYTKNFMESRFGYDFSDVKIHNDSLAHRSSNDINALAFTHGNHIVFGAGEYQPNTNSGKQLLAHELAHVVQQGYLSPGVFRKKGPTDEELKEFKDKNCAGFTVDDKKAVCEFNSYQKAVVRISKDYAIRKCNDALFALQVARIDEINALAKLIFHIEKAPTIKSMQINIAKVRDKLNQTPIVCKTCYDKGCNEGGGNAYVKRPEHLDIGICPLFFNKTKFTETPRWLIHEGCHLADLDAKNRHPNNEFYCTMDEENFDYWKNPCPMDIDNIHNADAWSFFIDRLSLKK